METAAQGAGVRMGRGQRDTSRVFRTQAGEGCDKGCPEEVTE